MVPEKENKKRRIPLVSILKPRNPESESVK
jgi:hypothetical protein